jgi:hypothetical protein
MILVMVGLIPARRTGGSPIALAHRACTAIITWQHKCASDKREPKETLEWPEN